MRQQHDAIDSALNDVDARIAAFASAGDARESAALADALDGMVKLLVEHLAVEEERALPLMERNISQEEWGRVIAEGSSAFDQSQIPLVFGMLMYEGDPDTIRDIIAGMPPVVQPMAAAAPSIYAEYALRVHSTATPDKVGGA